MQSRAPSYRDAIQVVSMLRMLDRRATKAMLLAELADALETTPKTVTRYVDKVGAAVTTDDGAPLVSRERRDGRAWVRLARESSPLAAGIYQYAAVAAASRWLTSGKGSVLGDCAEDALRRFENELGARPAAVVARVSTAFHYVAFGPKDYRVNEDVLDALVQATLHARPVAVRRRSRRDGTVRAERLEPFTIVMYRDGLYLLAREEGLERLRLYAVERFEWAEPDRTASFRVPPDFDAARHFAGRLGLWEPEGRPVRVEVAFAPGAAEVVRHRDWPGFRAWRKARDGRHVLVLELGLSKEVATWIVSWGPLAEVLRPKSLRDEVAGQLRAALARYDAPA